ncbi:hypothetical protein [Sorangium sp. So ce131]|uniref:hypothetical protein n=1 Tax=Sorangium sp. So ce131 TaxID=3133282 RepID=UPI003F5F5E4C
MTRKTADEVLNEAADRTAGEASARGADLDLAGGGGAAAGGDARTQVMLRSGYGIEAVESPEVSLLHVRAPTGRIVLTMRLLPEGPSLEVEGVSLNIAARGDLRLSADRLSLTARGDAEIACGGNLSLRAERGDVVVKANDDVRIDGERIALNSPDAPPGPQVGSPYLPPRGDG